MNTRAEPPSAATVPPAAPGAAICGEVSAAAPDCSNGGAVGMTGPAPATEGSGAKDGGAAGVKEGGRSSSRCCSVILASNSAGEGYSGMTKSRGEG